VSDDAVRFTAVAKKFDATVALAGLTFDVGRGEMFGLIGPDGAGKTTAWATCRSASRSTAT
jgi:ABC-2 type transport system ATP-binding protein